MTAKVFLKLIGASLVLLLLAMACVHVVASRVVESSYVDNLRAELEEKARFLAEHLEERLLHDPETVHSIAGVAHGRITIIGKDGEVFVDSNADPHDMENHRQRPEFREALAGRVGWSRRNSPTIGKEFFYVAVPSASGALRVAVPFGHVASRVTTARHQTIAAIALAFLPAVLLAAFFSRRVSRQLARIIHYAGELAQGNFRARLGPVGRGELGTLAAKLNETGAELEELFNQIQREHSDLEKVDRIRKDFLANVSHELRTPLASIQGYAETLLDGAVDDPKHNRRFLQIILQNSERLSRLTSDLLTLSRIELKERKFQIGSYYLNVLLTEAVDSIRPAAEKKSIQLTLHSVPDGYEVVCDSSAFHQIMTNLLDNAVKYTPEEGSITVKARHVPGPDRSSATLEISVSDTGIGIGAEHLPRLFERFYRVDKGRSRELGGTGLGLAIVKHMVKAHGGDVTVISEVNKGTTFRFTLPQPAMRVAEREEAHSELTVQ